jgi:uncharacterized protein (DUF2236 family)
MASSEDSPDFKGHSMIIDGLGLALAGANVIMQLSLLPVGHGIAESTVESGSLYRHPIKRTRTTLGYVMITLFGTDHERSVIRSEVNRQHQFVRSANDSPVAYSAFDPALQLWVAACMYRGLEESVRFLHGPQPPETLDELYRESSRFATTLQVPEAMWPGDRAAFETYWNDAVQHIAMDEVTRSYLLGLASLTFLPSPISFALGAVHRFITAGFLPAPFRDELGLDWGPRRQRVFNVLTRSLAAVNRRLPRPIREFPWNLSLWDARRRIRRGRPFV